MKRILVPCDFTTTATHAYKFACQLAVKSKGEIFLLHVVEVPHLPNFKLAPTKGYEDVILGERKAKVQANLNKMRGWAGKTKVSLITDFGSVSHGIQKYAEKKKIDLIIMGTHGASGVREFTIGSNTQKIVRQAPVPVISVHEPVKVDSIKHIIYPTRLDLTEKKLVTALVALQQTLKATLQLVYINTPADFTRDIETEANIIRFIQEHQVKNCNVHVYNDFNEVNGIQNFSMKYKGKIIAMGTHGRQGLGRLLSGSIAEEVVNHVTSPVWTLAVKH